jgi:hypothetical protein
MFQQVRNGSQTKGGGECESNVCDWLIYDGVDEREREWRLIRLPPCAAIHPHPEIPTPAAAASSKVHKNDRLAIGKRYIDGRETVWVL